MRKYFLETDRLLFSWWQNTDEDYALELWGNPKVSRLITSNGVMSKEEIMKRLNNEITLYNDYNIQYFPIFLKDNKEILVGCCGLRPYDKQTDILEMGIHLKDEFWGKGFATEACNEVIDYAFDNLKVKAIFAGHNPKNISSKALLLKLGFSYTHDEFYKPTGLMHPSYLLKRNS